MRYLGGPVGASFTKTFLDRSESQNLRRSLEIKEKTSSNSLAIDSRLVPRPERWGDGAAHFQSHQEAMVDRNNTTSHHKTLE